MTDESSNPAADTDTKPPRVGENEPPEPHGPIGFGTLLGFLIGRREAILTLAAHPHTVWLGLILVLSAGFAREYDQEDLLREPWHLLLPLAASLGTSLLLFGLVSCVALSRGAGFLESKYLAFLGLYWMTAPLAWIYAIPVERFVSAENSTVINLWFLALVSLWRVALITCVLGVLFRASPYGMLFIVMLFADTVALIMVQMIDVQIFVVMGGVRLTGSEIALANTKFLVTFFGGVTWPVWLVGTIIVATLPRAAAWTWMGASAKGKRPIALPVWITACCAVAVWGLVLPWTQPEQQLRTAVTKDIEAGNIRAALETMSAHKKDDFPPHWDPPPPIGSVRERSLILRIVREISPETAPWVRELFIAKFDNALGRGYSYATHETLWEEADVVEILTVLERLPEGEAILRRQSDLLRYRDYESDERWKAAKLKVDAILKKLGIAEADESAQEQSAEDAEDPKVEIPDSGEPRSGPDSEPGPDAELKPDS